MLSCGTGGQMLSTSGVSRTFHPSLIGNTHLLLGGMSCVHQGAWPGVGRLSRRCGLGRKGVDL